jgi:hypothetical protein
MTTSINPRHGALILGFAYGKINICYIQFPTRIMNFELNEEQLQIKYSVREFAESEIKPHVMEWDETQHFPDELRPKLAELGLLGVIFP